jgi:hypothetical protein
MTYEEFMRAMPWEQETTFARIQDENAKLRAALEAEVRGECPECGRKVKDWKPMFGAFAPEWWATMREQGIDPATGHRAICSRKQRR